MKVARDYLRLVHPSPASHAAPFPSSEAAWMWCMAALLHRRAIGRGVAPAAICEPDDVVKCLDRLYRERKIDLSHARVLRIYGERGVPPNSRFSSENDDAKLWHHAIRELDAPLRLRGIVATRKAST